MTQQISISLKKQQLSPFQFASELLLGWRQLLASVDDLGACSSIDIDRVAGALRADFVRLPILRFLNLDPVNTYKTQRGFFRWAQLLCNTCSKQSDCSLLAATAETMPAMEQYCSKASQILAKVRNT